MLDDDIFLFLFSKRFHKWSLLYAFLSRTDFGVLRTKITQDLTLIWWVPRAMNKTGTFWYIPWMTYITLLALYSDLNHTGVGFWRGGFSSHKATDTRTVGICNNRFLIRGFYNIFINTSRNFHAFKHIYRCFKSNLFTTKTLHIWLLAPYIWCTFQKNLIKFRLTFFSPAFAPGKASKY